jgi:hypothetical protein
MWLGLEEGVELGLGGEEPWAGIGDQEEVIPTLGHRHRWKEIIHLSIIQFIALIFHSNNVFIVHFHLLKKNYFRTLDGDKIENIVNFPLSVAILDSGCRGNQ